MNHEQSRERQPDEELVYLRNRVAELESQLASSRQAEADQQQINDRLPVLVATAGLDGYYKQVNPAFESILGWSEQESLSRPFMEFIHPDNQAAAVETFEQLKSGKAVVEFVDRNICKDGSSRWISWTVIPVPNRDIVFGIGQDITERKEAESALRESERKLSTLISNLPGAVYRCKADSSWTIEFLSDGYRALTGHEPSELIGQPSSRHLDAVHPEDHHLAFAAALEAVERNGTFQVEYRLRTTSGEEKWLWERGTGVFSEDGKLLAIEGFTTDITPLKRAESDLRRARDQLEQRVEIRTAELAAANQQLQAEVEQRRQAEVDLTIFQRFVESSTQGFGMADVDGHIVYANPFLARLFGAETPDALIGTHVASHYPPDYLVRRKREIIPALRRGEHWHGEQMLKFPDGQLHPTIHTIFPVRDDNGELLCTAAAITDITKLKQVEEALRQSHNELQTIYDGILEGILITDIETKRFMRVNASFCRMLGYSEEELLAASIKDIHPPEEVTNDERRFEAAAQGRITINEDRPVLRKDGSIFYADITGHRIFYNERPCLLALFRDVTERKQAEEKLREEQDALRRTLQASDHDRELITYEIHDGIAQRLAGAAMYFDTVSQMEGAISAEARPQFAAGLRTLRKASEEARGLMNRTRTPVLNRFGLKTAIADFIDQFADRPDAPEITYLCDVQFARLEPSLENTMFRVAQEAIANACFHSKGEIVRVSLIQHDGDVTIEVRDNGIGFDPTNVKENRFGLHGIRERVRLLGTNLKIESTPGQGTRIQATFPLVHKDEQAD